MQNLHLLSIGQFEHGSITCKKGRGLRKKIQCCVNPCSADTILYFRAIQGHSGGKHINHTLQDNVLLPDNFAERIYHVGRSHDTHSIIQSSGLIPGWQRRQEREACRVLYGRESNVHRSLTRKGLRRDEAQNCSVQK